MVIGERRKYYRKGKKGKNTGKKMVLEIGQEVPEFACNTQQGEIDMHEYITGSWCLFFSHPADFTPVCTTEMGMLAKLSEEFVSRNCKIVGLSVDSIESHEAWIKDIEETQDAEVHFPIIADEDGSIARECGMVTSNRNNSGKHVVESKHEQQEEKLDLYEDNIPKITVRTMYLIDPNRRVQMAQVYPSNVGRNFYEIIRSLDALQLASYHKVGTPANWKAGEDVFILPEVSEESAEDLFPKGFTTIKPYMRITPAP